MDYYDALKKKRKQYKLARTGKALFHIHRNTTDEAFCGIYDFWVPKVTQRDWKKGTCKNCTKWAAYHLTKGSK